MPSKGPPPPAPQDEDIHIHTLGASLYFGGYDLYMLSQVLFGATSASTTTSANPAARRKFWRVVMIVAMVVAFVCQAVRFCGKLHLCAYVHAGGSAPEIAEWIDALAIITFMYADVYSREETKEYFVGVITTASKASDKEQAQRATAELEVKLLTGEI